MLLPVALGILGLVFIFIAIACWTIVILHGFQRSVGTGFMVLLIPIVNIFYAFTQFEHRRKGLILAGWLGLFPVGVVLRVMGAYSA